jgi:hypothetical protein
MRKNLDYIDIVFSKEKYFLDEVVIFTNMYKIPHHPCRRNIKEIKVFDDKNKNYIFDLVDDLIFVSNDKNKKIYIQILSENNY